MHLPYVPLDPAFGNHEQPAVAAIDEARCIGCTLCIAACPVDAIVGAAGFMHTVLAAECTGCKLCVAPCPVDCIDMRDALPAPSPEQRLAAAARARDRYLARNERLAAERKARLARRVASTSTNERKRLAVKRAIERARARLSERRGSDKR
jgi:electron transport complex protein RnfB